MEDQPTGVEQANGRTTVPAARVDIPMSDEDRMKSLIAKCYEDGIIPEKFCHGEWVVEAGVRLFRVNQGLDTLVTSWLKERTVTVIFQGEARDLPLRIREDLVRAYENGWYRERICDRSIKRGRIHGEGPNVLSYVAKSGEVARWMIAKGEDKVVIRGIEYGMVFKPWMTKAELEERRRADDATKLWVVALRVPLRMMFHVESMVESAMGRIMKSLPPEPDKSRPKLMNLKFELAREAEDLLKRNSPSSLTMEKYTTSSSLAKTLHGVPRAAGISTKQQKVVRGWENCHRNREESRILRETTKEEDAAGRQTEVKTAISERLQETFRWGGVPHQKRDPRHMGIISLEMSPQLFGNNQYMNEARGYQGHISTGGHQRSFVPYQSQYTEQSGQGGYQGAGIGAGTDGVKEIHQVQAGALHGNPSSSRDQSGSATHMSSPTQVPGGLEEHQGGVGGYEERWLMPLVCMMQAQEVHVVGLVNKDGKMVIPAQQIDGLATVEVILRKVREMFVDRFRFKICPDGLMPKMDVDLPGGKRVRYSIPLIDARFEEEQWANISRVGLTSVPINAFSDPSLTMLSQIVVDPGVPATAFDELKNKMPSWQNFASELFARNLSNPWTEPSIGANQREGTFNRIHLPGGPSRINE
ncbi:hypothetical protein CBR_g54818 [Chara braunii]|uniref:Uncharacterized protein n=1 Tax=Chara braunii TaxID=69332 RepID=A0A388JPL3_CHABU|nr:hypothetical protein CBR_g54818 [Chara braunii]|eukprot:GBG59713.1 hypothetical protein CBR_g54818 [Chara braunii]